MKALANLSISRKLVAAFGALVLALLGSYGLTYHTMSETQEAARSSDHSFEVRGKTQRLVEMMVNQETGVRGYLLSANPDFLTPYREGRAGYEATFQALHALVADNLTQQQRLDDLNRTVSAWRADVAEKEISLMSAPDTRETARHMEASGAGKALMDDIRDRIKGFDEAEARLMTARSAAATEAYRMGYLILLGGGILAVLMATVMERGLSRGNADPIVRMTDAMTRLAHGDKAVDVPALGRGDEVGRMAEAVEVFKRNAIETERLALAQAEAQTAGSAGRRASAP